ncbi:GNAT family N-acetyltransferase [Enterococcus sp. HY326]|uniref:GNAT family N-acetyltransferase n=1 Tax=Enterococcus sp. HY326 TaxID=2971265 RepID=UPI00223FE4F1|nr:GNAT family N-acetyltransferase [Enterococcus sp. HY326]
MKILHSKDTMSPIYLDALKIRNEVFMKEQGVPFEREVDKDEALAVHFVMYNDENQAMATLRLLPISPTTLKLQRMAVSKPYRQLGLGKALIAEAERFSQEQGFKEIELGAQKTAISFYEGLGYHSFGEEFIDADMPHLAMKKFFSEE